MGRIKIKSIIESTVVILSRFKIIKEFWLFIKDNKKWWLLPLFFIIFILTIFLWFISASPIAPIIYTIF